MGDKRLKNCFSDLIVAKDANRSAPENRRIILNSWLAVCFISIFALQRYQEQT
jgi:hypothetical protein